MICLVRNLATLALTALLAAAAAPYGRTIAGAPAADLFLPASSAYSEPDPEALDIRSTGLKHWHDSAQNLVWYGKFARAGRLMVRATVHLPALRGSQFRLIISGQAHATSVTGGADNAAVSVGFGPFEIAAPGYQRIALQALEKSGDEFGDVTGLTLSGPASDGARFNTVPEQRGAPSVHLHYPTADNAKVVWFYNEVTARTDPLWTYYMACGWHRGYFGMQVNSPTERRLIVSVWDSGKEAVDRSKVSEDDKVKLLAKGDGVFASGFGNEGTGGHSHLVYPWKTGNTYRFLVAAEPEGAATIYTGYFYFPEKRAWGLIARFRAPGDGAYLHSLYSFDEDFNSANGQRKRLAEFGRQWVKTADGRWTELTRAVFTHTGKDSRTDYDARATRSGFALSGGGYQDGHVHYRDKVERRAVGGPPPKIDLPRL